MNKLTTNDFEVRNNQPMSKREKIYKQQKDQERQDSNQRGQIPNYF